MLAATKINAGSNMITEGNALIRFFLKQDPSQMDIQRWCESVNAVNYGIEFIIKLIKGKS